jgi:PAS domain S-box-containing protein
MIQLKMTLKPSHTSMPPDGRMGRIAWAATRMKIDQPDQAGPWEIDPQIRDVLDSIPGLVSVSQDGKLEYVNHQICELLGVSFSAIQGERWISFIHADDKQGALQEWHRRSTAGCSFQYYCRVRNRDGEYRWCHWLLKPLCDRGGDAVKYVGNLSDVDASRGLSEPLDRASRATMGDQTAANAPPFRGTLQRAVSSNAHGPSPGTSPGLSARECTVLTLIAKGQSNKRIAQTLGIAPETVKSHLKHILIKLESKTRAEAVARAGALGFFSQSQDPSSAGERRDFRIVERVLAARALAARSSLP